MASANPQSSPFLRCFGMKDEERRTSGSKVPDVYVWLNQMDFEWGGGSVVHMFGGLQGVWDSLGSMRAGAVASFNQRV